MTTVQPDQRRGRLRSRRRRYALAVVVVAWALLMAPLLWWGLPSTRDDARLFGGGPPWKAAQYQIDEDLRRLRERPAGADTDLNPLAQRDQMVDLTVDAAARAEILRRYRLFSRQPDEMITLRALQRMNPRRGDFDPQLYQYGGGYIYLVGAALASSAIAGFVTLTSDAGVYLEHPELFARFYVVARMVSLVFGALTLVAVWRLGRLAGGRRVGWIALVSVALTPVFVTGVLEAKPHLPSACLILWATGRALRYRARGRLRDAVWLGLQAGYAFGLVLTGSLAALLWPAVFWGRPRGQRGRAVLDLALAGVLAVGVYVATNPYIPYNGLTGRAALGSNVANSTAMYQGQMRQAGAGAQRVATLLVEGGGPLLSLVGLAGFLCLLRRNWRATSVAAATGIGVLVMGVLLGAHKPAEFGRFLLLPIVLLAIAAAALLGVIFRRKRLAGVIGLLLVLGFMGTAAYVRSFVLDARGTSEARAVAGRYLAELMGPVDEIGVLQEPAPYAVPPLDFAHRRVWLLPTERPAGLERGALPRWLVFTADNRDVHAHDWWQADYELRAAFPPGRTGGSPITWANKSVFVYERVD